MSLSLPIKTGGPQIASQQVIESPFHSSSQNRKISTAVVAVSAEKAKSVPETDSSAQGKSFDTFHPFLRLPAEIKAMILEEAIEYDPAIVYGHCELDKKNHELIKILHGTEGKDSKVKYIRQLVDVLPEFQTFVEAKFGKPFSAIKRWPSLAVRLDKDLMVFIFKRRKNCYFDWYSKKQRLINHSQLAPGIRNVGIRFNADCSGMGCICNYTDPLHNVLCPLELSMFCESLSHLQNLFVLVKLDVGHMLKGPLKTKVGVKSFIERRLSMFRLSLILCCLSLGFRLTY